MSSGQVLPGQMSQRQLVNWIRFVHWVSVPNFCSLTCLEVHGKFVEVGLGLAKIYLFCQKITALPSWVSMRVCELKMSNFKFFWLMATALLWPTKWLGPLYKWEKKLFGLQARTHGFNAKIGFEKFAASPKILTKKCQKSAFQTKPPKFDTFWLYNRIKQS